MLHGTPEQVHVRYRNRYGRERSYYANFEGVVPFLDRRLDQTDSEYAREKYEGYMRDVPCPVCKGARLKPEVLAVTLPHREQGDRSIAEVTAMSVADCSAFLDGMVLDARQAAIAGRVLKEVQARLGFLLDVGLHYLSLDRAAGTLSGGEAQRIRLATQIGSGLVGVLYVLDEPSIGLHQRDNRRLIETLTRLRDMGNTLIVVEHDEDTIRASDWAVDIGPGAGEHGGEVVHSGPVAELEAHDTSLTGAYLSGRRSIPVPAQRRPVDPKRKLSIVGAREHNLRDVDVDIPLGRLVSVTGVSGSGKSTLINDILATVLANRLNGARQVPGRHTRVTGLDNLDKLVRVDQSPIGRTPRSNPATYTGVWDQVRKLFAATTEAKVRGYQPGRFSFNVKGGRCEACSGDGTIKIEMNFLPDVYVPCEVCRGARYNRETLEVHYKGKTVADVLDMPIEEAAEFFAPITSISRYLRTLVDVGLGYVRLGQPAPTLSGGEAQRVKLASELQKRSNGRTVYILDEPTTGLHFEDIRKLLGVINGLVDKGNSVIVIEHNLDVIKTSDWIIDMGPEGGSGGGMVVAQGTPEQVAANPDSYTGEFLRKLVTPAKAVPGAADPAEGRRGQLTGAHRATSDGAAWRADQLSARLGVVSLGRPLPRVPRVLDPLRWLLRAARPGRAGRILLERDLITLPGLQHRLDDPPQLFGLVAADRQRRVALHDLLQQQAVGGQLLGGERGVQRDALEVERVALAVEVELQRDRVGGEGEPQDVRVVPVVEGLVRDGLEVHRDLTPLGPHGLSGAQPERRAGPPPVPDAEGDLGEGLGAAGGFDALGVGVGRQLLAAAGARGVPTPPRRPGHLVRRRRRHRAKNLDLAVADVPLGDRPWRLHRHQREHLQEVVLDHVAQRAGAVVVVGPPLQAQGLVPRDVDPADVVAVPHRLEDPVGEPQPQHVEDGLLGQEVVDAEHVALVERACDQRVELAGVGEIRPEGLLDDEGGVLG